MNTSAKNVLLNNYWTASTVPLPLTKIPDYSQYHSTPFSSAFCEQLSLELPKVLVILDGLYPLCYYLSDNYRNLESCTFIVDKDLENKIPLKLREHMLFFEFQSHLQPSSEELDQNCEELILDFHSEANDLGPLENKLSLPKLKKVTTIVPNTIEPLQYSQLLQKMLKRFGNVEIDFIDHQKAKSWKKCFKTTLYVELNNKKRLSHSSLLHHFLAQGCLLSPSNHAEGNIIQRLELSPYHQLVIHEGSSQLEENKWLLPNNEERLVLKKAFIFQEIILSEQKQGFKAFRFFENNLDRGIMIGLINDLFKEVQQEYESEQWVRR